MNFSWNINKTVLLSLLLHAGFFAIGLALSSPPTLPLPLGMELKYTEINSAPSPSAKIHRSKSIFAPTAKDLQEAPTETLEAPKVTAAPVIGSSAEGALAGREGVANGQEVSPEERYLYEVQKLLERRKSYPAMAKKMGHTGTVVMRFTMLADGTVSSSEIVEKSPYASLNQAATDLVRGINGMKPFPSEIQKTSWSMTIPIRYELK